MEHVVVTIATMCPNDGWALGGEFSTADVVFGGFFRLFNWFKASPKVASYVERIWRRPAYQETHAGFISMNFQSAAKDKWGQSKHTLLYICSTPIYYLYC